MKGDLDDRSAPMSDMWGGATRKAPGTTRGSGSLRGRGADKSLLPTAFNERDDPVVQRYATKLGATNGLSGLFIYIGICRFFY
jgi:hypothetical protein